MNRVPVLFVTLTFVLSGTATAVPYVDVDGFGNGQLIGPGAPFSSQFDLIGPENDDFSTEWPAATDATGFDPQNEVATSGIVSFWLTDDDFNFPGDEAEWVKVDLEGLSDGQSYSASFNLLTFSDVQVDFLGRVNDDGKLDYTLSVVGVGGLPAGDTLLRYAMLEVDAEAKVVPETSALALWGIIGGVFGMGCWFRRKRQIPS